jgi:hypothetical protein
MWHLTWIKTHLHIVFTGYILLLLSHCWWRIQVDITSSIWTSLTMDLLLYLTSLNLKYFCLWQLLFRWGMTCDDNLNAYWSTTEQFISTFYSKTMRHDKFLHILRFLHFSNNDDAFDSNDSNYDYGKYDKLLTCWMTHIENITFPLNIWLWTKL